MTWNFCCFNICSMQSRLLAISDFSNVLEVSKLDGV